MMAHSFKTNALGTAIVSGALAFQANAQDIDTETRGPDPDAGTADITLSGLVRANMKWDGNGCVNTLPNALLRAERGNWTLMTAGKIDNLSDNCAENLASRLMALNLQYAWENTGTQVSYGLLLPFELTKAPLTNGFTQVAVDNFNTLRGGVVAARLTQNITLNETSNLQISIGSGHKPDDDIVTRFGPAYDNVRFLMVDYTHAFNDNMRLETGYRLLDYTNEEPDSAPDRRDHFIYIQADGEYKGTDIRAYIEHTDSRLCLAGRCEGHTATNAFASATREFYPWLTGQFAAGIANQSPVLEASGFINMPHNVRFAAGAGYNFDDGVSARIGLMHSF